MISATADEVGAIRRCLTVSYAPTLCTSVRVVRPELALTKEGPTDLLICQDLTYRYLVSNTGTGECGNYNRTASCQNLVNSVADRRPFDTKPAAIFFKPVDRQRGHFAVL